MISISQLEKVVPEQIGQAGVDMRKASEAQDKAKGDYESQVQAKVADEGIWRDPAKANAQTALNVVSLSFDTAATQMIAASTAMGVLAAELVVSREAVRRAKAEAEKEEMKVSDDGNVTPTDFPIGGPHAPPDAEIANEYGKARKYSELIKTGLRRATTADERAGGLIDRAADAPLPLGDTGDPGVLQAAQRANDDAYVLLGEAVALGDQLQDTARADLDRVLQQEYTVLEILGGFFKGLFAGDPQEAIDKGQYGTALGSILGIILPFGKITKGAKAAASGGRSLLKELGLLARRSARKPIQKPEVKDPKLKNFVDANYKAVNDPNRTGNGTTADAIRHERATGGDVKGKTHITKGRDQVRGLRAWLKKNPNADPEDRAVAQRILDDLNDALKGL